MAKNMANGILENLNRSLEINLRDNLDGLKEFTLMMASTSVRPQFETLPVELKPDTALSSTPSSPPVTLLDTQTTETFPLLHQLKKRA